METGRSSPIKLIAVASALVLFALAGCSDSEGDGGDGGLTGDATVEGDGGRDAQVGGDVASDVGVDLQDGSVDDCAFPLTAYCASDCPTYDESVEKIKGDCGNSAQYVYSAYGTCDAYRFTEQSSGYGGPTLYFDGSGTLIAVRVGTDNGSFCNYTSDFQTFGPVPSCGKKVTEKFCAPPGM